jgi:hypothetical protein
MPNRFDDFTGAVGAPIMQTPTTGTADADPITTPVNTGVATDPFQMGNTSVVQSGMGDMNNIVQDALRNYSTGIQQQRQAQMEQLGTLESGMFDQMGRMQLQSERDIANRRMQALRSGMPSSQLAALELQNVQTAQLGAQQMAQQYDDIRMQLGTELAGAESMMAGDLTREMLQGRVDMEAIDAQRFTADTAAQMRQMFPNWDSMTNLEKMQAIQALSGVAPDAMIGDPSRFASGQQDVVDPETGEQISGPRVNPETGAPYNVELDDNNEPIVDDDGEPKVKWALDTNQTPEQLNNLEFEFLRDLHKNIEIEGNRVFSIENLTANELGIGHKAGEVGSGQTDWVNKVRDRALSGQMSPGDFVDLNAGAGNDWYLFTGDGFIKTSSINFGTGARIDSVIENGRTAWYDGARVLGVPLLNSKYTVLE